MNELYVFAYNNRANLPIEKIDNTLKNNTFYLYCIQVTLKLPTFE